MPTAKQVMAIAKSQIGIMESPANSNNVKFNTAYYGHRVYGVAYSWCAVFEWWCGEQAAQKYGGTNPFPKNANAAYAQDEIVSKKGGKWILKKTTSASKRKAALKKMKMGDVVCFDFGAMDAYRDHTGLVLYVSGDYVYTIEGNTSKSGSQSNGGRVCKKKRHYTDICSCARPKYNTSTKKAHTSTKKTNTSTPVKKTPSVKKPKIYINAGHSNTDPGAVSKYGNERVFNVKVRNAMIEYLKENYQVEIKYNKGTVGDLKKITAEANEWKADLYVSIHFNSGGGDGWEGLLYKLDDAHERCGHIFEKHVKAIGQNSRGLKARPDLKNLSLTHMMAILNECAFIDKWKDIKDWNEDKELKKMGIALAKAAAEYTKAKKKA